MTTTDTPRTRMETAHLLCDSDDFEDVISTLKKEGKELERELNEAKAEVERLDKERRELSLELHMWEMGNYYKPKMQSKIDELEAEVKEIRAALGDAGRRTHKEVLELATKASQWREWKEKYIDLRNAHIAEGQDPAGTIWEHADKLQKKIAASQAEVERLREILRTYRIPS